MKLIKDPCKTYIIGGYSLAGLFALWASTRTDLFFGVAAASPSVWFPGFIDYMADHSVHAGTVGIILRSRTFGQQKHLPG
jgi:predicted alpha/beta superfamily hydrolase